MVGGLVNCVGAVSVHDVGLASSGGLVVLMAGADNTDGAGCFRRFPAVDADAAVVPGTGGAAVVGGLRNGAEATSVGLARSGGLVVIETGAENTDGAGCFCRFSADDADAALFRLVRCGGLVVITAGTEFAVDTACFRLFPAADADAALFLPECLASVGVFWAAGNPFFR